VADASKTIDLIFNGIDKTGAATQAALRNLESFASGTQNLTQPLADFTVGAVKLEAGILAAGAAMTAFAVKLAGDFDSQFRQLSTLFDATEADVAAFRTAVQDYAKQSGKSMDDVMGALSAAIGSGVAYTDSLGLLSTAEKLAIATRADLQGTTEVLVGTMNAYGMSTKDAGALADLMFQIIKDGKIEMADLSQYLARVTPIASAAGVSMEEVGAAVATLTAAGMQPASAIDALKSAISNIVKPSEQAAGMAEELGIQFDVNALKSKGLAGVLDDVRVATGGSADKMARLFGDVQGLGAVLTLTGPQAEKFGQTVLSMGNSAGSVATAFAKMAGDMDASVQRVTNAFTGLMIQIGEPLLNEFGGVAAAIAKIFGALGDSVKNGALGDLVAYVEGLFGDLQGVLEKVAQNLPAALAKADLSGFKGGIDAVVQAFKGLFGSIDLTSVDGLTRAIELAGTAFLGLSKFTAGVIESFGPLFDYLTKLASQADGIDMSVVELAGNIGGFATQMNVLAGAIGGAVPWFEALLQLMVLKQGIGLLGAVKGVAASLPALTTQLAQAGVVFSAYYASDNVVKLVQALLAWHDANGKLAQSQQQAAQINEQAGISLERFAQTTGIAAKSIDEALALVDSGAVVWSDAANGWVKAGTALDDLGVAADGLANPFDAANKAMLDAYSASEKAATASAQLAGAQKDVATYTLQTVPILDEATGAVIGYEQQLVKAAGGAIKLGAETGKAAGSLSNTSAATQKAAEAQERWNQEVAKMDHATKLKLIEQQTTIAVANIEADTQRMQAAFSSLNTGIESTGETLATLWKLMADSPNMGFSEQWALRDQIEAETNFREQEFQLQSRLINAQIAQMQAQTQALNSGGGLIKIDGAGLKPHLEAFMWEILKAIQVRVNSDGLKMLLGV
jgi:TP901 family phage tail tape measure protein